MAKRNLIGAPGTKEVARQLARWEKRLSPLENERQRSKVLQQRVLQTVQEAEEMLKAKKETYQK
jgi:hypothetical protein